MYQCLDGYDQLLSLTIKGKRLLKENIEAAFDGMLTDSHAVNRELCRSSFMVTVVLNGILAATIKEDIDYLQWGYRKNRFLLSFDARRREVSIIRDYDKREVGLVVDGQDIWDIVSNSVDIDLIKCLLEAAEQTVLGLEHDEELRPRAINGDLIKAAG